MRSLLVCLCVFTTPLVAQEETKKPDQQPAAKETSEQEISAPPKEPKKAPAKFHVKFETTQGNFIVEVTRKWAPLGADQFYNLVNTGYYDNNKFFRVLPDFVVQFGLNGNPKSTANWKRPIKDDPVVASNMKGYVTYATGGKNTRTTQLFVNMKDNQRLDGMGFAPFGKVVEGMPVLFKLYSGYGKQVTNKQGLIKAMGNEYLEKNYPKLDGIKKATVMKPGEFKPKKK